jgi:arylsulfatase A-like enzyme
MSLATETFRRMRQQVTLINLPEFDWPLGHVNGGIIDHSGVKTLMHRFDSDLAALQEAYHRAGVLKNTVFVLMADHGMMPLRHTLSDSIFSTAVSQAGTEIVTYAYTSAGYIWVKDAARTVQAARNIAALHSPYIQSVYARVRTVRGYAYTRVSGARSLRTPSAEAANQYLVRTFNGPNAPDIAVIFAEGVGCEPGGQSGWKADHGGTSWQAQQIPLVISGPGIRQGHVSSYPARLIDVAPTILQAMGASHKGMQGIPLADALLKPPGAATQWQASAAKRLGPVVSALQQESSRELAAGA